MTSRDFCYWLQGALELFGTAQGLTPEQLALIQKHLALVFVHEIDPSAGRPREAGSAQRDPRRAAKPGSHLFRC